VAAVEAGIRAADSMGASRFREQAMALARAARLKLATGSPANVDRTSDAVAPWGLSKREQEVLALLVEGRTNRQIADALFIGEKTASVHVTHIMTKLGVASRTEAALLSVRAGVQAPQ
jgi:DNA-binding NarL/FixJ family response regulator